MEIIDYLQEIIDYLQEFNIVLAVMGLTDQGDRFPGLQVNSCKE